VLRFQPASDPRTIEARVLPPSVINATLIDAASLKPKPKPKPGPEKSRTGSPTAGKVGANE
jgi:hypothetical protein